MASLLKDLEAHLLLHAPLRGLVGQRVFATQIPDGLVLPYVRVEKTGTDYERFSTGKFEKAEVTITAYGETSEQAEAVGRAVLARMQAPLFLSTPPRQTVDCRSQDDATQAEAERGKEGIFRYAVPLAFKTTVHVPKS